MNNEKISNYSSNYSQKDNLEKIIESDKGTIDSILSQIKREKDYLDNLDKSPKSENNPEKLSERINEIKDLINTKKDEFNHNEDLISNMVDLYSQRNALQKLLGSSLEVKNSLIDKLEVAPGMKMHWMLYWVMNCITQLMMISLFIGDF